MKLSKRVPLLILPVLLSSYLLVAMGVYWVQKDAILSMEQARLSNATHELASHFKRYRSFLDSLIFSVRRDPHLSSLIQSPGTPMRDMVMGRQLQESIRELNHEKANFVSVALLNNQAEPLYYYEQSASPFSSLSPAQQQLAKHLLNEKTSKNWQHLSDPTGHSLLLTNVLLDRRTLQPPLPGQLDFAIVLQAAIEPQSFDNALQDLQQQYLASWHFSTQALPTSRSPLQQQLALDKNYWLIFTPSADYLDQRLRPLKLGLSLGLLVLVLCSALLLLYLLRRHVTDPVSRLELEMSSLEHQQQPLTLVTRNDEIGQLARRFQQLYNRLLDLYQNTQQQADTDPLTQLPNRHSFQRRACQLLEQAHQQQQEVVLLYLDLDNFKFVNDKHGHETGDALLKAVALRLQQLSQHWLEQHPGILARLAGDEFALLVSHINPGEVEQYCQRLLQLFRQGFRFELGQFPVTLSVGVARYPQDGHSLSQLITNADTAMYQAKHSGRNQLAYYSQELAIRSRRYKDIEHELRHMDYDQAFKLVLMPICSKQGELEGVEALLRWHSPHLGWVGPDEFIPIAEQTGLYQRIDEWVLRQAVSLFPKLQPLHATPIRLAINLSAAELANSSFVEYCQQLISLHPQAAGMLELEVTETVEVHSHQHTHQMLAQLRQLGFSIAIDDFGTGYTSFLQLVHYPVDRIKLDRSFISRLCHPDKQGLLQALIQLCHSQQIEVVAEGVETLEQAHQLIACQCDYLQGYYLGKPMSLEQLQEWLKQDYPQLRQQLGTPFLNSL
ncbi:putative bifunctional diguanylate cyclase/phosphodiesterase [Balneatrix alpica]|uniref:Bifunctional diguanylate cyclase/phosphodiesterase n=1 Tax=Balneatrix alpica TaxID=75684 RepID=A0ABV5ZCW3_9GAMM|nr:EAL domain-containing protein [Balneatrix alpica]